MNRFTVGVKAALAVMSSWFRTGSSAHSISYGEQISAPARALVSGQDSAPVDYALQISTVWRCIELLSKVISTLPVFVYRNQKNGMRELARLDRLYYVFHDQPNPYMTSAEFWSAMLLNWLLKGNAYARIDRDERGEVKALWPLSADQVTPYLGLNEELFYLVNFASGQTVLFADDVLHLKDTGNGLVGMSRISFMGAGVMEARRAQATATSLFRNGDKPAGLLFVDRVLTTEQRATLRRNFAEIAEGPEARLHILEANMKFEKTTLTPNDAQLLGTRQFGVEELCRWFGVPPVLVGSSTVTTWGTGIEQILDGFYKLTVRPMLVLIEQSIRMRVLTPVQQQRYTVEFSFDALLRANAKDRLELYAKGVQNGIFSRNECRQLENLPPVAGGDVLTAQVNLVPLEMLGKTGVLSDVPQEPVAQ
jgi:HK97 family phage portal protein